MMIDEYLRRQKNNRNLRVKTVDLYRTELQIYERLKDDLPKMEEYLNSCSIETKIRKLGTWKRYAKWLKDPRLDDIEVPRKPLPKPPNYLHDNEMQMLLSQLPSEDVEMQIFVNAGLRLGLRLAEILKLSSASIEGKALKVNRKGGRIQLLPCPPDLLEKIAIFKGFKFRVSYYQKHLKEVARRAGISRDVSPHALRHSFATKAMRNNFNIAKIQEFLGHSHMQTTCRYLHVEPEDLRSLVE